MNVTSLHPGDTVADRRLVRRLGEGGEGEVWEVHDPDGRATALKLIRPVMLPDADKVRERGRWLVQIDHPALVRVRRGGRFTNGPLSGWGFVEMDLVVGHSMAVVPPVPDALDRLRGVADGLDLLHRGWWSDGAALVHRDVKPGNLIDTDGGLVLVDPSTLRGADATELTRVGTPAYVAPEVFNGRFGAASDRYSLAATAAALLTGRRGHDLLDVLSSPHAHRLPAGLVDALAPDPDARPASCAAVLADRGRPRTVVLTGDEPPDTARAADRPTEVLHRPEDPPASHAPTVDLRALTAPEQEIGEVPPVEERNPTLLLPATGPAPTATAFQPDGGHVDARQVDGDHVGPHGGGPHVGGHPMDGVAEDGDDQPPVVVAGAWPVALLALLSAALLLGAGLTAASQPPGPTLLLGAVVGHLVVHTVTGRPVAGLLGGPWAWGDLVAVGRRRRRRTGVALPRAGWLSDTTAGAILLALGAVVVRVVIVRRDLADPVLLDLVAEQALVVAGAAWAGLMGVVVLARAGSWPGHRLRWSLLWTLLLIPRAVGAVPRLVVSGTPPDLP